MKIRKATMKDAKEIEKVENYSGYHESKINFRPFIKEVLSKNGTIFCAEQNKNIVGYASLGKDGEVGFLGISKKYQRKGIATKLIQNVILEAKKSKIKKLFLEVKNTNFPAIILYTKFNFKITGIVNKKITKLKMEKII